VAKKAYRKKGMIKRKRVSFAARVKQLVTKTGKPKEKNYGINKQEIEMQHNVYVLKLYLVKMI
jgi:hypothetical protein